MHVFDISNLIPFIMADKTTASEDPSIEEILDSIRQIISEDNSVPEQDSADSSPDFGSDQNAEIDDMDSFGLMDLQEEEPEAEPEPEEDVFELTDVVEEEPEETSIEVDLIDMDDTPPEPEPEPVFEAPPVFSAEEDTDPDSILTEAAANAAYDAMTTLVRKTAVEHNGITLEDIVRAELKPLLRAWLDKNLPIIIDRLVREELERVSKRALDE